MADEPRSPHNKNRYSLLLIFLVIALGMSAIVTRADTPVEFSLPIPDSEANTWTLFTGVGTKLEYPPSWQGRAYSTQGGVLDGATYEFIMNDEFGPVTRIEMLEITSADIGNRAQTTELAYWQRYGAQRGYTMEEVTVQGRTSWWIYTEKPASSNALLGTLWVDGGERTYRFRIHCREGNDEEGVLRLRQMLSTLKVGTVDWNRAAKLPMMLPEGSSSNAPSAISGVPYNRSAAFTYAQIYHSIQNNADGCYLWYDGSQVYCTPQNSGYGVDGAHFVNQAVAAGGRGIPGLWDGAASSVADLCDWLQNDGWTIVDAAQAAIGDVAIIGPFTTPCWAGLVVDPGADPTLATHSAELWSPASVLSCSAGAEKTYLHTDIEYKVNMPIIIREPTPTPTLTPTPTATPPMKQWSGMHMGNRYADWSSDMLAPFSPPVGMWPRIVVVQSNQVFTITRYEKPNCRINGVIVKSQSLLTYLQQAAQVGTRVIIRISPSPGNFEESTNSLWPDKKTRPAGRTLITEADVRPENWLQCDNDWRFRPVDDVGDEILVIQRYISDHYNWQVYGFEPANEPNVEWYARPDPEAVMPSPSYLQPDSWQAMDQYFATLYDYVHANEKVLPVRVLTPPMSQSAYAETHDIHSDLAGCLMFDFSGYEEMELTYNSDEPKNDGYSWHNYWIEGRERFQSCPYGQHVSMWFPVTMTENIQDGTRPAVITEADLASPRQGMGNPIISKDVNPDLVATSIRTFLFYEEKAENIAIWLLNDDTGGQTDHTWHQAYTPPDGFRAWFTIWWNGNENP